VDREQIENIALLSIHPKYAHSILNGDKLVEFRKTKFKKPVKYCLIYSTSPDQKIIGFFEIKKIEENSPSNLWEKYGDVGQIEKHDFLEYYQNSSLGVAIVINKAWKLQETFNSNTFKKDFYIPQSFMYLNDKFYQKFKFTILRHLALYDITEEASYQS